MLSSPAVEETANKTIPSSDSKKVNKNDEALAASTTSSFGTHGRKCSICAKLPFRGRRAVPYSIEEIDDPYFFDGDMCEFLYLSDPYNEDYGRLEANVAANVADRVHRQIKKMQKDLAAAGLVAPTSVTKIPKRNGNKRTNQFYPRSSKNSIKSNGTTTNSSSTSINSNDHAGRMMAPFRRDEIKRGRMLGAGGFSVVYEIEAFQPDPNLSADMMHPCETAARYFLTEHARRKGSNNESPEHSLEWNENKEAQSHTNNRIDLAVNTKTVMKTKNSKFSRKPSTATTARYALKHLRPSLATEEYMFQKAAIDMAIEAQILLILDHPNIISIRGWSQHGADAIRSGQHSDFFLIMDRLPETLEDRLHRWRQSLKRYKYCSTFAPWRRSKYQGKIHQLFLERLKVAYDIASAIEYLHDRRIMHRDLKVSNIGFDIRGDLKLFDFGLARLLPVEEKRKPNGYQMSRVGTKYYMAPEVRNKQPYDLPADVYSFGVLLWEILSLATPREVYDQHHRRANNRKSKLRSKNILKQHHQKSEAVGGNGREEKDNMSTTLLPVCSCWPDTIQEMTRRCLSEDYSERPSISEVRLILYQQMQKLGMPQEKKEQKRRRSSFRLDLSQLDAFVASSASFTGQPSISRTSHFSSHSLTHEFN